MSTRHTRRSKGFGRRRGQQGATLLEAIVAVAVLGIAVYAAMSVFGDTFKLMAKVEEKGVLEDFRNSIRAQFSCTETVPLTRTDCKNSLFAQEKVTTLYNDQKKPVLAKSAGGIHISGKLYARVICDDSLSGTYSYRVQHKYQGTTQWQTTFPNLDMDCPAGGNWYPAPNADCPTFCSGMGMTNTRSPDTTAPGYGSYCASGECFPQSALDSYLAGEITFPWGTWGANIPWSPPGMQHCVSEAHRCYGGKAWAGMAPQKRDHDATDNTAACHCE